MKGTELVWEDGEDSSVDVEEDEDCDADVFVDEEEWVEEEYNESEDDDWVEDEEDKVDENEREDEREEEVMLTWRPRYIILWQRRLAGRCDSFTNLQFYNYTN